MWFPLYTKILIVPDFGVSADDETMVALKSAIEAQGKYSVKVADLPALVRGENKGDELTESRLLELSALKLEQIAECGRLKWDGSNDLTIPKVKRKKLKRNRDLWFPLNRKPTITPSETKPDPVTPVIVDKQSVDENQFDEDELEEYIPFADDQSCLDYEEDRPHTIILFGESAMFAGKITGCKMLFVNPEYSWQIPWKKKYYALRKLAEQNWEKKYEYVSDPMEILGYEGDSKSDRHKYLGRYSIITNDELIGEFWNQFPWKVEVDRELDGDTLGLARFICDFAKDKITNPLAEVYEAIMNLRWNAFANLNENCYFAEPVKLSNFSVLGILFDVPKFDGQSGHKLLIAGQEDPLPLESIHTRRDLNLLRDAIDNVATARAVPEEQQKRILIVPDYFSPYNSPTIQELYLRLKQMGYYVAVFVPDRSLEDSRRILERRLKSKKFDLIVAIETGCLLVTRIDKCPRIFVDPDWLAWEWMKLRLGDKEKLWERRGGENEGHLFDYYFDYYLNDEEIQMARKMSVSSYIKRGPHPVYGWFTEDLVSSHLPEEHIKRFKESTNIPGLRLDTEEGITILAQEIHKILSR